MSMDFLLIHTNKCELNGGLGPHENSPNLCIIRGAVKRRKGSSFCCHDHVTMVVRIAALRTAIWRCDIASEFWGIFRVSILLRAPP